MSSTKEKSLCDFIEMSAGEFKYFLQQRGLPVSGGHGNLAARALIAFEQNLPILSPAENVIDKMEKQNKVLLSENNISFDHVECSSDDIKMWPEQIFDKFFQTF